MEIRQFLFLSILFCRWHYVESVQGLETFPFCQQDVAAECCQMAQFFQMGGLLFAIKVHMDVFSRQDFLQSLDGVGALIGRMTKYIGHDTW